MIILQNTSTTLVAVTNSVNQVIYTAEWDDLTSTTTTLARGSNSGSIVTATTTTVTGSPAAMTERSVKQMIFKNLGATNASVLIQKFDGTNYWDLSANVTLAPQASYIYVEDRGYTYYGAAGIPTGLTGATGPSGGTTGATGASGASGIIGVYANGIVILSNSSLNFNNSATVLVNVSANGLTQSNISFSVPSANVLNLTSIGASINTNDVFPGYSNVNQIFQQYTLGQIETFILNAAPIASTTTQGKVKLIDNFITADTANAATANALLAVYNFANNAFANANGAVTSVVGTANQISVSQSVGTATLSFPAALTIYGNTGNVNVSTTVSTTALGANLNIQSGAPVNETGTSGTLYLISGNVINGNTGAVRIQSAGFGTASVGTINSGSVFIQTGSALGNANSGSVTISTGTIGGNGICGSIGLITGTSSLKTNKNIPAGSVSISTGGAQNCQSGSITFQTGAATGQSTGSINFEVGNSTTNAGGYIFLNAGGGPVAIGASLTLNGGDATFNGGSVLVVPGYGDVQANDGTTQIQTAQNVPAANVDQNATFIFAAATAHQGYVLVAPGTGYNNAIPNFIDTLVLNPAATIATCNVTLPSTPVDGQHMYISTTQTISTFNVAPAAGQTLSGLAPTTFANTAGIAYLYVKPLTKWVRKY